MVPPFSQYRKRQKQVTYAQWNKRNSLLKCGNSETNGGLDSIRAKNVIFESLNLGGHIGRSEFICKNKKNSNKLEELAGLPPSAYRSASGIRSVFLHQLLRIYNMQITHTKSASIA